MDHVQGDVSEDDDLQILDNNKEKDEFDISSSDDGGLFNKVGAASKMVTKKKPAIALCGYPGYESPSAGFELSDNSNRDSTRP